MHYNKLEKLFIISSRQEKMQCYMSALSTLPMMACVHWTDIISRTFLIREHVESILQNPFFCEKT